MNPRAAIVLVCLVSGIASGESIELAGRALDGYPHFDHVRAFRDVDPVQVAVDPSRHPSLAGRTCDLYVVPDGASVLADVRPGGAQTVTLSPSALVDNIFTIAGPGELSAAAGASLGVGYDVVLDCNRDGVIDSGDAIDGRGDEPGFYRVRDTTLPGPLAITQATYQATFVGQGTTHRLFYPTEIATMGRLPLVVISHGWTLNYTMYGHIGTHLASYGYIVLSHTNDVGNGDPAGTLSAGLSTLANTDGFLGNLSTILDGLLVDHVDDSAIALVGHSTGGEGIVRAYTLVRTRQVRPDHFIAEDVKLLAPIAPIAPVAWLPASAVDPFDANLHMFLGGADSDTSGAPLDTYTQPAAIFERSTGNRQLTYVHGVGHSDFDAGNGIPYVSGPDLIGQAETHRVVRGYYLPLMELYLKDNPAGRDYFERSYEDFHPAGIAAHVVISTEHRAALAERHYVIDDFEQQSSPFVSSSGAAVRHDVANLSEILMQDLDGSLAWSGGQPANGMSRARFDDAPHAVVFDWNGEAFYELDLLPTERDLTDDVALSFRLCQGTRHPETVALDAPLSFVVTLIDGAGERSSIDFARYGRVTRPYPRTGQGAGAGWQNEFTTVRIRLTDFIADGAALDLTDIATLRFEFGPGHGSPRGRIGLDDVEILRAERPPLRPVVRPLGAVSGTSTTFALRD